MNEVGKNIQGGKEAENGETERKPDKEIEYIELSAKLLDYFP